jgi:hypothetical protein
MAQALARWQQLVASHEATVALHWEIFIMLYRPGGMVIKIAIKFVTFIYIVDNSAARNKYFSLIFMIELNRVDHALVQPLFHVAHVLNW